MTPDSDAARLVAQLRRRERWLLALAAVRTELLSGGTVHEALTLIAERCAALVDADAVIILLPDENGRLAVWAAAGPLADLPHGPGVGPVLAADDPWATAALREPRIAFVTDLPVPGLSDLAAVWAAAGPLLIAPVPIQGGAGGLVVCLRGAARDPFEPEAQPEIVGLAEQASIALDVADRNEQRRAYELMADRERIARDLHDHVIQRLFAVGLSLHGQLAKIADEAARGRVDDAVNQIDEAIADLRSSIFDLRASGGASRKTLRRRLTDIAAVVGGRVGDRSPRVTVRIHGPVDTVVDPHLADDAEAVVREAVSNAVRHSGATTIAVTVTAASEFSIVVSDDGFGIPEGAARSGLKNLALRAAAHGGNFEVDSTQRGAPPSSADATAAPAVAGPGTTAHATTGPGTTVRWTAPLS